MPPVPRPTPTGTTKSTGTQGKDTPPKVSPADKKLATNVADTYTMLGMMMTGAGMAREDQGLMGSGQAMMDRADRFADAWLGLANKNPKVKTALLRFTEGTATAEILVLHVAVLMPLLASRGVVPVPMAMAVDAMVDQDVPPTPDTAPVNPTTMPPDGMQFTTSSPENPTPV